MNILEKAAEEYKIDKYIEEGEVEIYSRQCDTAIQRLGSATPIYLENTENCAKFI